MQMVADVVDEMALAAQMPRPVAVRDTGFSTSVRNVAVSLVIATASFSGSPAVTAALAYGLFQTIVLAVLALVWGRIA
jgi:hypothetical protein